MDIALRRQLKEIVAVKSPTGVNNSGDITYGSASDIAVRIERKQVLLYDRRGEEVHTNHFLITEVEITEKMRVWFPGNSSSDATLAQIPKAIEKLIDEKGAIYGYLTMI